ncbi:MAG TPA: hypothetical protein VFQ61_34520 [Polyangiaceae bacterium]|nr:hypothetical protein [Polyangiaceae bacterium]
MGGAAVEVAAGGLEVAIRGGLEEPGPTFPGIGCLAVGLADDVVKVVATTVLAGALDATPGMVIGFPIESSGTVPVSTARFCGLAACNTGLEGNRVGQGQKAAEA